MWPILPKLPQTLEKGQLCLNTRRLRDEWHTMPRSSKARACLGIWQNPVRRSTPPMLPILT